MVARKLHTVASLVRWGFTVLLELPSDVGSALAIHRPILFGGRDSGVHFAVSVRLTAGVYIFQLLRFTLSGYFFIILLRYRFASNQGSPFGFCFAAIPLLRSTSLRFSIGLAVSPYYPRAAPPPLQPNSAPLRLASVLVGWLFLASILSSIKIASFPLRFTATIFMLLFVFWNFRNFIKFKKHLQSI